MMNERNYNVTGKARKALVNKMAELTVERPVYLGMPTVAFKVGPFEVSRTGILTWEDWADDAAKEMIGDLRTAGFRAEGDEEPVETAAVSAETAAFSETRSAVVDEAASHTVEAEAALPESTSSINGNATESSDLTADATTSSFETAQNASEEPSRPSADTCEGEAETPLTTRPDAPGEAMAEDTPEEVVQSTALGVIPDTDPVVIDTAASLPVPEDPAAPVETSVIQDGEPVALTISLPDNLTDQQFMLLRRTVDGKATLIRHAFKCDTVEIIRSDGKISFPWFTVSDSDHTEAYTAFLIKLIRFAKRAKRVTAHDRTVENESYAFRCFLLRLDMIGAEYKTARRILLENLSGNKAWKSGAKKEKADKGQVVLPAEQ